VIVSAETGCTDSAKPVASDVTTNPRREKLVRGTIVNSSGAIVSTESSPNVKLLGGG
jgi:hypothetical protein